MDEKSVIREFDVLKEGFKEENLELQLQFVRRLVPLAKHLGPELTRTELLPFLRDHMDYHDEILLNVSDQLEQFIPLVGGYEHAQCLLDILVKLCDVDETVVREKAVASMNQIVRNMDTEMIQKVFLPVVEAMSNEEWFTGKCSATGLFAVVYPHASEEKKADLRNIYKILIQDDSPIVRRAAAINLLDLIELMDPQHLKDQIVPVLDILAKDSIDAVRVLAVEVALALCRKLTENDIEELVFKSIESWSEDLYWTLRQKLAINIADLQVAIPFGKTRGKILAMYQKLLRDFEANVRKQAVKSLGDYCQSLKNTYQSQPKQEDNFEPVFVQSILPHIKALSSDHNDEVRAVLSSTLISLISVLSEDCFKQHVLPLIVEMLETDTSPQIQANILKNLNFLPATMDLTRPFHSLKGVLRSLIANSSTHWRTRRCLLVGFMHIAKVTDKEYFEENLKVYYAALLGDKVFAIRRTAPAILPLLVKYFGINWTTEHIIPYFNMFRKDVNYLYRYVPLFGIKELISPSVDTHDKQYLKGFQSLVQTGNKNAARILAKINLMVDKLQSKLEEPACKDIVSLKESIIFDFKDDNVGLYAEDTLDIIQEYHNCDIFNVTEKDVEEDNVYIKGLLQIIYTRFFNLVLNLFEDPIVNIQIRSIFILTKIRELVDTLRKELEQDFVKTCLKALSEEEMEAISKEVEEEMQIKKDESTSEHFVGSDDSLNVQSRRESAKGAERQSVNNEASQTKIPDIVVDSDHCTEKLGKLTIEDKKEDTEETELKE
ncbi:unnamed protein product [Acanthoscelides obtectus]|uniref:Phosphatase PP2A regulatory subunit A/Splicing factor 3B subunit 1-like HEAT repeat domain-containing protein n=1 Tax=Acanthoscelides obtectus TaxID=200917 RepID=A0A9P0P2U5_ACAOB|nr:unnamed protein product [Acanthoscelides obtectus]CAK1626752.1 Serine/threonine-protein phosphatase 2A 65 kDa regulatory subunit A beta isoform [Acanthoscelides obtectus]